MRKTELAIERCKTMSTLQKILGGKWKIEILYYIAIRDIHRFGELRRHIGEITESSLTKQLRELEADGFLIRHDYHEVPSPCRIYSHRIRKKFISVLNYMKSWATKICKTNKQSCIYTKSNRMKYCPDCVVRDAPKGSGKDTCKLRS